MNKKLISEINRIRELTNTEKKDLIVEGEVEELLSKLTRFFEIVGDEIKNSEVGRKLKNLYDFLKVGKSPTEIFNFFSDSKTTEDSETKGNLTDVPLAFQEITNEIINQIEGGYYHPSFRKEGAKNTSGGKMSPSNFDAMGDSGETMFGLDREHGGKLNTTAEGIEFWNLVDDAQKKEGRWAYNYFGGNLENTLRDLVAKILYNKYVDNSKLFFTPESKKIVESNRKLFFQFAYATWNGTGYFERFAKALNEDVKNGITNPDELYNTVVESRRDSGQSNRKIAKIDRLISSIA